ASSHGNSRFHVVLGNESCDLDSMVSSLAMAYFLSRISSGVPGNPVVVPVLNIPRSEFHLRADGRFLLRESGVATETLVFRDEVDLARLHGNRRLALTLVDHNVLPSTDGGLEGAVVEVIDHHQLERTTASSCPVTVETVASCATLVTERILTRAPEILDRQLALMLYGVMVADSVNLSPEAGRVTAKDRQMVRLLETQFPDLPPRGALHPALHRAKVDLSGFTTEQILLKNMKTVAGGDLRIAVSIVFMTLDLFLQRKSLQQELCEFCHSRRLSALVAMTISFNDQSNEPVRQLAVYSSSSLYRHEISHALCSAHSPSLRLAPLSSPYKDVVAYHQGNALASRKKLLPVLKRFLSDWERGQMHCGADGEEEFDRSDMMISDASPGNNGTAPDLADDPRPRVYSASRHHRRRLLGAEDCGIADEDCYSGGAVPPTPMNSLVDGCPLDGGFNQEALLEKFSRMEGGGEGRGGQ
uniref:exopolyphosphatase PRUNE1-like n=1 Tax=Centroberyx gerrardi TaxID=166262 RepID=UPI003AAF46DE